MKYNTRWFCAVLCGAAFLLLGVGGLPVFAAEEYAKVTFYAADLPQALSGRSIVGTIGTGPSDASTVTVILSELNQYTQTVQVQPGTYYCTAAVQYDPSGDYPLTEENGISQITATPGAEYVLTYTVGTESWFESVTGQQRFCTPLPTEPPPEDFDTTAPAQLGAYLTAPQGFDRHTVVYLENLYTGKAYPLDLYGDNLLSAVNTDAESGKYSFVGGTVSGDTAGRYSFSCEGESQLAEDGVNFHITILDTTNRECVYFTPSREENETVQEATAYNAAPTTAPQAESQTATGETATIEPAPHGNGLSAWLDLLPVLGIGIFLFWRWKKQR